MAVSAANLRDSAKIFANMQQSAFLSDAEWDVIVAKHYVKLWGEVVAIDPQFRVTTASTVVLTSSANSMTLAADFMGLLAVVKDPGTTRERYLNPRGIRPTGELEYRIEGNKIFIEPMQVANGSFNYRYTPQSAALGSMDVELEQFREYVELGAAITALATDESDITQLAALQGIEKARVTTWAKKRRKTDHEVVEDVRRMRGYNRLAYGWEP